MPHESFEVQTVDYCKWELFQGGLWVIICSALQGAVLGPRGQRFHGREKRRQSNTCWATDSQHETSQQACLLFLMSVIYMKEPLSPNRNSVLYAAVWLTGFHISRVTRARPPPLHLSTLPPRTTWWWLLHYSSEHVASGAGVKCSSSVLVHVTADGTFYLSYWETEVINWKCAF